MRAYKTLGDMTDYEEGHQCCETCMGAFHPIQNHGCTNSNEVTDVVIVEGLVVCVALQSDGCIVCRPQVQTAATQLALRTMLTRKSDDDTSFEASSLT